jgi:hypothetical protein
VQCQGVHGVCGVPGPCQLTRATVMDVVSIDEFEDFLFVMGIPASDLIFVDPYLQDLQLTQDVFAMVRRLLYLHRGASRSPTPEHIAKFTPFAITLAPGAAPTQHTSRKCAWCCGAVWSCGRGTPSCTALLITCKLLGSHLFPSHVCLA